MELNIQSKVRCGYSHNLQQYWIGYEHESDDGHIDILKRHKDFFRCFKLLVEDYYAALRGVVIYIPSDKLVEIKADVDVSYGVENA